MNITLTAPNRTRIATENFYPNVPMDSRMGVMLHYDASMSDRGAVEWFKDPRCKVSYNYLVLDDGTVVEIAPVTGGAWHAGKCKPDEEWLRHAAPYPSANRALWGVAAATTDGVDVTARQLLSVAWVTRTLFSLMEWPVTDGWRIVGHSAHAWERGRKSDPEGSDPKNPILSVADVRDLVRMMGD